MTPQLGFDTIGNATLIVYDGGPVLATDPWLDGPAYFGSWCLSHAVPEEQRHAVARSPLLWISHGHPDHLSYATLERRRDATILLADHVGNRIRDDLRAAGFCVEVLPDRTWRSVSPRVRVMAIADVNQDSILVVDIGGVLVVDVNDASERGWEHTVRRLAREHDPSFLLALSGYGDADMINYFDEDGVRIVPPAAERRPPGAAIQRRVERLGVRYFVPFASMHRYQRSDSAWVNEYTTPLDAHRAGFASDRAELLDAFIRYDCLSDTITPLRPPEGNRAVYEPADFGDDWDEPLRGDDAARLDAYFEAITTLRGHLDEIVFEVGESRHVVRIGDGTRRSVVFATPRASLMKAVEHQVFDDLMIGNFTRTTLRGAWPATKLNADFTVLVGKYADNGRARTPDELRRYVREYRRRAPLDMLRHDANALARRRLERTARQLRGAVAEGSVAHRVGRAVYRTIHPAR